MAAAAVEAVEMEVEVVAATEEIDAEAAAAAETKEGEEAQVGWIRRRNLRI